MTENIKDIVNGLLKPIEEAKLKMFEVFNSTMMGIIEKHKLHSVTVRVNNHEFADGDPTSFSVYYDQDCINLFWTDSDEIDHDTDEMSDEDDEDHEKHGKFITDVKDELYEVFSAFDVETFYEDNFSEHDDSINFFIEGDKLKH